MVKRMKVILPIFGLLFIGVILLFIINPLTPIYFGTKISDFYYSTILHRKPVNEQIIDKIGIQEQPSSVFETNQASELSIQSKLTNEEAEQIKNSQSLILSGCIMNAYNKYLESWIQTCGKEKGKYNECLLQKQLAEPLNLNYRTSKAQCLNQK